MAESVEVLPRFHEPDAPHTCDVKHAARAGILVSMYENKIIVLAIIVVIIIIGIVAYVIYRRPDECHNKQQPHPVPTPQQQSAPPAQQPYPAPGKRELAELLARSKAPSLVAQQQPSQSLVAQQEADDVDELSQLANDIENELITSTPNTASVESDTTDVAAIDDDGRCTAVLYGSRTCRNRARANGKCHLHQTQ